MFTNQASDFNLALSLKQRRARQESGLFLAEGRKLVAEGLTAGCPCQAVYVREDFLGQHEEAESLLAQANTIVLGERKFRRLADTEQPQGVIGVFEWSSLVCAEPKEAMLPVLFDVADPRNMGNIVRSADWFGLQEIVVGETCVDPFNGKAVRSSMGSVFRTRFVMSENLVASLKALKERYRILVADTAGTDYRTLKSKEASAIVFSNEARGPSPEILALADAIATIPGSGRAESLCVATAAAVMFAAFF